MYFRLENPFIVEVTGKHAQRYLNARLTNNIRDLQVGSACQAGALTPQGRIEGFFTIARLDSENFLVYADGGDHQEILSALKRYIVADRVDVLDRSDTYAVIHRVPPSSIAQSNRMSATRKNDIVSITISRSQEIGEDIIGPRGSVEEEIQRSNSTETPLSADEERLERFRAGILKFPDELTVGSLFSEADLDHAVSFTKGCYVGQEVIEKIDSHGKSPRVLRMFSTDGKLAPDLRAITSSINGQEIGEVVSEAFDPMNNITYGLSRVRNDDAILASPLKLGNFELRFLKR